jgi:flagellar motor switch protein FliN/FliY
MKIAEWLAQEWARQIGPALSSMTGDAVRAEAAGGAESRPEGEVLHVVRRLREAPKAVLWIAVGPDLWRAAGQAVLRGADLPGGEEDDVRSAFLEVMQHSLGQLAVSLGRRLGREVTWEEMDADTGLEGGAEWAEVEVTAGEQSWGKAWVAATSGFVLESGREETAAEAASAGASPAASSRRPMLDLLMEVELPVGVTFGRTQLRLKDAIKLTSGSIVELNRSIIEPVEVIVNNCVIARGEVVVVEGNYGVRIQEIVSREERLRTLF